jgi:hypothetical protein
MTLGSVYCAPNIRAAWKDDMTAVADLPDWAEVIERNPGNRRRILDQNRDEFIATMERWMMAYCPQPGQEVPGAPAQRAARRAPVGRPGVAHIRRAEREQTGGLFVGWPLLAPQLLEWADKVLT